MLHRFLDSLWLARRRSRASIALLTDIRIRIMSVETTLQRIASDLTAVHALTAANTAAIAAVADTAKATAAQVATLAANAGVTIDTTEVDATLETLEHAMQSATDQAALTPAPSPGPAVDTGTTGTADQPAA